ncbi:MAG: HAD family hydrolase [Chloroflexi bacterium]|nr:HAD family hydrolase [Chloroflexota bacterium]
MKALIFDFDGLILDTEMPDFESWQAVYRSHDHELAVEQWGLIVGGTGASDFDPHTHLEQLTGQPLDREQVWVSRRTIYLDTVSQQPILPGVLEYLDEAQRLGLQLAVASSSPENWVHGHLARLGLIERFHTIKTADDVARTKPDPELYNAVLTELSIQTDEAIVFEDSPNGVLAAKRANIYVVAVPNPLTAQLKLSGADMQLKSLADIPLAELLLQVNGR